MVVENGTTKTVIAFGCLFRTFIDTIRTGRGPFPGGSLGKSTSHISPRRGCGHSAITLQLGRRSPRPHVPILLAHPYPQRLARRNILSSRLRVFASPLSPAARESGFPRRRLKTGLGSPRNASPGIRRHPATAKTSASLYSQLRTWTTSEPSVWRSSYQNHTFLHTACQPARLFVTQRYQRVDARSTSRRQVIRKQRHRE